MSPSFTSLIKDHPYLFKNKDITTNFIRFCLSEFNIIDLVFLAGMKDFNDKPTPERALLLFNGFCKLRHGFSGGMKTYAPLLNTTEKNVNQTEINLNQGILDYQLQNKFRISNKINKNTTPFIPTSLATCLDIMLSDVKTTLIAGFSNLFNSTNGIYTGYSSKTIFTKSTKFNTLVNYKITEDQKETLRVNCESIYFPMINLEMKTMISVVKEVQNMK
jgi:hypothetical protein